MKHVQRAEFTWKFHLILRVSWGLLEGGQSDGRRSTPVEALSSQNYSNELGVQTEERGPE
jgi:hypothetical protein